MMCTLSHPLYVLFYPLIILYFNYFRVLTEPPKQKNYTPVQAHTRWRIPRVVIVVRCTRTMREGALDYRSSGKYESVFIRRVQPSASVKSATCITFEYSSWFVWKEKETRGRLYKGTNAMWAFPSLCLPENAYYCSLKIIEYNCE